LWCPTVAIFGDPEPLEHFIVVPEENLESPIGIQMVFLLGDTVKPPECFPTVFGGEIHGVPFVFEVPSTTTTGGP